MGFAAESGILNQAKKGQGETNDRLEQLIELQKVTNNLLSRILAEVGDDKTPWAGTTRG